MAYMTLIPKNPEMQWVALLKMRFLLSLLSLLVLEWITEKQCNHSKRMCGKVLGSCHANLWSINSQTGL